MHFKLENLLIRSIVRSTDRRTSLIRVHTYYVHIYVFTFHSQYFIRFVINLYYFPTVSKYVLKYIHITFTI